MAGEQSAPFLFPPPAGRKAAVEIAEYQPRVQRETLLSSASLKYQNPVNMKERECSQGITLDFIQAGAGIYRQAQTIPDHGCRIEG
jgi:hypothetical protein